MVCCQGVVGRSAVAMVTELVLDNRKVIDRITTEHIKMFVQLLDKTMVSVARDGCLPFLICCCHVWCVCDVQLLVHRQLSVGGFRTSVFWICWLCCVSATDSLSLPTRTP